MAEWTAGPEGGAMTSVDNDEEIAIRVAKTLDWQTDGPWVRAQYEGDTLALAVLPDDDDYPYYRIGVYVNGNFVSGEETLDEAKVSAVFHRNNG